MFDPQTTNLIRQAPELPELDRERLPEELTRAFAAIVAFRVRLAGSGGRPPHDLFASLERFRRMAATFEAMVALQPDRDDRQAAAFVAAQAHHLLLLARQATGVPAAAHPPLRAEAISPNVSALLLFLIANQPSDAMEMAETLPKPTEVEDDPITLLAGALAKLASGRLADIPLLSARRIAPLPEDVCDAAAQALYIRLLHGLGSLAQFLLNAANLPDLGVSAVDVFRQVQRSAAQELPWPVADAKKWRLTAFSTFPGPHHLATLLIAAADYLGASALSGILPPSGILPTVWNGLLKTVIVERPFLWPNHQKAIDDGLLMPGTSAVISFPTGAGKTTLSVLKTAVALGLGGAVIYLAPTHALVGQMKTDLRKAFPDIPVRESLIVEDFYTEIEDTFSSTNAQIVVMTPERCLALLSMEGVGFGAVRLVIFDECHLMHPRQGGQNRRSLDAMLAVLHLREAAPSADWLLLSAMIENAHEIAGWLAELLGRRCIPLNLDWKPTRQARGCLAFDEKSLDRLRGQLRTSKDAARKLGRPTRAPGAAVQRQLAAKPYGFFCLQQTWHSKAPKDYVLLPLLEKDVPLAANGNWFLTTNKNTVAAHLAAQCVRLGLKVLLFVQNTGHVVPIAAAIDAQVGGKGVELTPHESKLLRVATEEMGARESVITANSCSGAHHSNMLPSERELVESLFSRKNGIKALAATPTLAQGMNLPAEIVFIVGDERFDKGAQDFTPLEAHELLNAAGRAGRAGHVAQGMVIVLSQNLVEFDFGKQKIGRGWPKLQELFSSADQCLAVQDPIRYLIDRVQDEGANADADVRYFLRRLPRSADSSTRFLNSTLGAWHAKRSAQHQRFQELVAQTLEQRADLAPLSEAETWRDDLAHRTGIALELIDELHEQLILRFESPLTETEEWIRWFFDWLGSSDYWVDALLGHRLSPALRDDLGQGDLFGSRLAEIVWSWMSGETLRQLNTRLGGKANNPGKCSKARKFVLKLVPELAFAAGLATRIRRHQIEEAGEGDMPLTLATLGLCVREGLPEPEVAALRLITSGAESRQSLLRQWNLIRHHAPTRTVNETFSRTRRRVTTAFISDL